MSHSLLVDLVGWIGAVLLLVAYASLSTGHLAGGGWPFQAVNLVGALGLLVNGFAHDALPSAALNLVWSVVAVAALAHGRKGAGQQADSASRHRDDVPTTAIGDRHDTHP